MGSANPGAENVRRGVPIDYGHGTRRSDWARSFRAECAAAFDGFSRFSGMLIGLLGGVRQLLWMLGFAFSFAGLGVCLQHYSSGGPLLMFIGGALIGMIVPAPKPREDRKQ